MKRPIVTMILLLLCAYAPLAQSQNIPPPKDFSGNPSILASAPHQAPLGASIFYVLMGGASESYSPGYWAGALRDRSITAEEDRRMWAFARQLRDTNLAFQHSEMDKLCANKGTLNTLDSVAAALTKFDANNDANIEQLGNDSVKSLGDRLGSLLSAAASKSSILVLETDHKQIMLSKNKEPIAHINAVCAK